MASINTKGKVVISDFVGVLLTNLSIATPLIGNVEKANDIRGKASHLALHARAHQAQHQILIGTHGAAGTSSSMVLARPCPIFGCLPRILQSTVSR